MKRGFYIGLAAGNIRRNRRVFFPYMLASTLCIAMFFILATVAAADGVREMRGGQSLETILNFGCVVTGIFSAVFLFYTNSFLLKRRKKELGLYSVLGMDRKNIARMLFFESFIVALASIAAGVLTGAVLSRLMFLVLLKLLRLGSNLSFSVSLRAAGMTGAIFGCVFLAALLSNLKGVAKLRPVELLKGGNTGEREPKTKWLLTLIGLLCLGSGYTLALTVKSPLDALVVFLIAVILVMAGTYFLFASGSIALLKLLRMNKKYYYRTKHFIPVSGMLHRMKQNAVGLANICILGTAVLVIFSVVLSLYAGAESVIEKRYPRDIEIRLYAPSPQGVQAMEAVLDAHTGVGGIRMENRQEYRRFGTGAALSGSEIVQMGGAFSKNVSFQLLLISDYNRIEKASVSLAPGQALVYKTGGYGYERISAGALSFAAKELSSAPWTVGDGEEYGDEYLCLILPDAQTLKSVLAEVPGGEHEMDYILSFDIPGENGDEGALASALRAKREEIGSYGFLSKAESRSSFYSMYGGLLFIGCFLGLLFLMAAVLIIYYKQVSEGYEDRAGYEIMKKVGMGDDEIRRSIKSQILTVFFLPLGAAVVHMAFAFKVLVSLLRLFDLTDAGLFLACTAGTVLVYALVYAAVYSATARSYYRIVR